MGSNVRSLASTHIKKHEGYRPDVYFDSKKNPTIGHGLNLRDPQVKTLLQGMGYSPEQVISGETKVPQDVLESIYENILDKKLSEIQEIFAGDKLSESQLAALTSLHFNSPKLIGPNLVNSIKSGDYENAAKEILLKSNKTKSPGLAKRRIQEAELFDPNTFQKVTKTLQPEEQTELQSYFQSMPDTAEKRTLLGQYPFLDTNKILNPRPFYKLKRNLNPDPIVPSQVDQAIEASMQPQQNDFISPMDITQQPPEYVPLFESDETEDQDIAKKYLTRNF